MNLLSSHKHMQISTLSFPFSLPVSFSPTFLRHKPQPAITASWEAPRWQGWGSLSAPALPPSLPHPRTRSRVLSGWPRERPVNPFCFERLTIKNQPHSHQKHSLKKVAKDIFTEESFTLSEDCRNASALPWNKPWLKKT